MNGCWEPLATRLGMSSQIEFCGIPLRVQSREDLRCYKSKIAFDESKHLHDVDFLQSSHQNSVSR